MKLKDNFVLRQVADTWVVMPVSEATVSFNGMLTLNESGALLWRTLEKSGVRDDLVAAILAEYEIDEEHAAADVDEFIEKLFAAGCLDA